MIYKGRTSEVSREKIAMDDIDSLIIWEKDNPSDKVWWGDIYYGVSEEDVLTGKIAPEDLDDYTRWEDFIFSFDKKKVFWLFRDYPEALTAEEKAIFDKENPFWVGFFKGR